MFNNRGGWGDRGNWRGFKDPRGGVGRGNIGNQRGRDFRNSSFRGDFRGRGNGFEGRYRGFHRDNLSGNFSPYRGRGYGHNYTKNDRNINFSAGDQSLHNFPGNNAENLISQESCHGMKKEPLDQSPILANNSTVQNSPANGFDTNIDPLNQSPDISSSTSFVKLPDGNNSALSNINSDLQTIPFNTSNYNEMGNTQNTNSKSGVNRCEPCNVGIVGETVSF